MAMNPETKRNLLHWQLDRRIGVPQIVALVAQTVALVAIGAWFASSYDQRIARNLEQIRHQDVRIERLDREFQEARREMARQDERFSAIQTSIGRIERMLERWDERLPQKRGGLHEPRRAQERAAEGTTLAAALYPSEIEVGPSRASLRPPAAIPVIVVGKLLASAGEEN